MNYVELINKNISFLPEKDRAIAYKFVRERKFNDLKDLVESTKESTSKIELLYSIITEYLEYINIEEDYDDF